ncbi:MAG: hypothetical protein H6581_01805 [Bacteroidia bacterium]|nr:hypothetical protein [Bacteroidia bacterium]
MKLQHIRFAAMVWLLLSTMACGPTTPPREKNLIIFEEGASPGDIITLEAEGMDFSQNAMPQVTIGEQPALVLAAKGNQIQVMVPKLKEGSAKVVVTSSSTKEGETMPWGRTLLFHPKLPTLKILTQRHPIIKRLQPSILFKKACCPLPINGKQGINFT